MEVPRALPVRLHLKLIQYKGLSGPSQIVKANGEGPALTKKRKDFMFKRYFMD